MVFFSAVFAARTPAMGNSADRAWQLSQLVEGGSTAFNPSRDSLSCVETNCVSFASAQARKLNRSVCFSFPHEVGYFVGTPTMVGHCASKQIGRHDEACHGYPRCVSRSPEARRFRVFARTVRVSQPAVLSALLVIQLFGIVIPPPYFPKKHQKERCGHYLVAALLHYVLWCASEYSVVGRISCYVSHDSTRTNVCQWSFAKKFLLLLLLYRIDSIRNLFIIFALDFPALENPISEKTNCCIQPSSHSSHASSSSSNQSGLSS